MDFSSLDQENQNGDHFEQQSENGEEDNVEWPGVEDDGNDDDGDGDEMKEDEQGSRKSHLLDNINRLSKYKPKQHRNEVRKLKTKDKRERRKRAEAQGLAKQTPKTIESMRVPNDNLVEPGDEEVIADEALDEMAAYFSKHTPPKVLITTTDNPHSKTIKFCRELRNTIPNCEFRFRRKASLKRMVKCAGERDFTDILVVNEDWRKPNALLHIHLPDGPTAYYRLSSVRYCKDIKNRARYNQSRPEVIMNNMTTRLGHTVGRMLASLYHYEPQFKGRKVITFHNQRDYIFFRHHLYEFKNGGTKVAIRELGPRFTLKLRSLQRGTFDSKFGEFEWIQHRHDEGLNRRKFSL